MKKLVSLLLVAVMSLSLMACGGKTLEDVVKGDSKQQAEFDEAVSKVEAEGGSMELKGNNVILTMAVPGNLSEEEKGLYQSMLNLMASEMEKSKPDELEFLSDGAMSQVEGKITITIIGRTADGEEIAKTNIDLN